MNPYDILDVPPDADDKTIASAHRKAAKRTHPDKGGNREQFEQVSRAALILRDPVKRAKYDRDGTTDDAPDNRTAQLVGLILPIFQQQLDRRDPIAETKRALNGMLSQVNGQVSQVKAQIARFEKARKRLLRKQPDTFDFLGRAIETCIADSNRQLAQLTSGLTDINDAIAMVDQYGWDLPDEPPTGTWTTNFFEVR